MLLINGLKSSTASKNFNDFNNMFKGIDPENFTSTYIAILVIDKVKLECNPSRSNDVDIWFNEELYYEKKYIVQTSDNSDTEGTDNESIVSDIID